MGTAFGSVVAPKLDPELKLMPGVGLTPELKLMPEFVLEVALEFAPRLAEVTVTLPAPGVPRNAGSRLWPRMSRTGRGTSCAKSATMMRMPNSISRERFRDSSVRSAEMRAARYVEYPSPAMIAKISRATKISTKVNPDASWRNFLERALMGSARSAAEWV